MPWTANEEEANAPDPNAPWPEGQYRAKIRSAVPHTSGTGSEGLKVELAVQHKNLEKKMMFDYWFAAFGQRKAKNMWESIGSPKTFKEFHPKDYVGSVVGVVLDVEPAQNKKMPDGTIKKLWAKNNIAAYVTPPAGPDAAEPTNDDLPF